MEFTGGRSYLVERGQISFGLLKVTSSNYAVQNAGHSRNVTSCGLLQRDRVGNERFRRVRLDRLKHSRGREKRKTDEGGTMWGVGSRKMKISTDGTFAQEAFIGSRVATAFEADPRLIYLKTLKP